MIDAIADRLERFAEKGGPLVLAAVSLAYGGLLALDGHWWWVLAAVVVAGLNAWWLIRVWFNEWAEEARR